MKKTPIEAEARYKKKYIRYDNPRIYALYYRSNGTLYINLNFQGECKVIVYR